MRALMCRGVQRTGSGMEGGEGEVQWRVGNGRADKGPVVYTGKGTGREKIWHSAQRQRNCPPTLTLFPVVNFALNFRCCVCNIAL